MMGWFRVCGGVWKLARLIRLGQSPRLQNTNEGSGMSQKRIGKWARRAVWITLAAIFTFGCNPLATIAFLTNGEPIKEAQYPLEFKEGPKKGKEVVVAVFVTSAPGIGPVFAGSE